MKMSGVTWYRRYQDTPAVVIDVETSIKNRGEAAVGNMLASPFHPDNKVVLIGQYKIGPNVITIKPYPHGSAFSKDICLVGHNIKFDLLYLIKESSDKQETIKWLLNDVIIWDTMVVEYLLTGQQDKFISLDDLSLKYGGSIKDSKIKKYWEDGVDTEDIPKDELVEYLAGDLRNTALCFVLQRDKADKMGIHDLIGLEMESLKDTIITEWYGMYIDIDKLESNGKAVMKDLDEVEGHLRSFHPDINWMSPKQVHAFLYGGEINLGKVDVLTGTTYKTGKKAGLPKTRKEDLKITFPAYLAGHGILPTVTTDEEGLIKNLAYIDDLRATFSHNWMEQTQLIHLLLRYRALYKDFHTYYIGVGKLIWPNDSCVHATYNHTGTATGRLSCHSPNLQNITSKE